MSNGFTDCDRILLLKYIAFIDLVNRKVLMPIAETRKYYVGSNLNWSPVKGRMTMCQPRNDETLRMQISVALATVTLLACLQNATSCAVSCLCTTSA